MRTLLFIFAIIGSYLLLRGWPGAPGLILRCCLAIAALVIGLAIWGIRGKQASHYKKMVNLRKATLLDYFSLGIAVLFAEACLVVFTSMMAKPAQEFADLVHDKISVVDISVEGNGSIGTGDDLDFGGDGSGPWIFKKNLERDLPQESNHKPSNKPEVFIELENESAVKSLLASRVYVSSFAFSQFNGTAWSAAPSARTTLREPIQFPSKVNHRPLIRHKIFHAANATGQNVFCALHGAVTTNVDELTRLAESIYLLPTMEDINNGYVYIASSQPLLLDNLLGRDLVPGNAAEGELVLPSGMLESIRETALSFRKQEDVTSQLLAVRKYLLENYEYSLQTSNPDGLNPLENFLYNERRGYCEHFATAAAMFCRALGIPSRVAYGWSGGRLYLGQNMLVFRAKDAHAWTEVKIKGYGWVVFDTTPPDNNAASETSMAPEGEKLPDPSEVFSDDDQSDDTVDDSGMAMEFESGTDVTKLTFGLGALCICSLAFLGVRFLKRKETTADGRPIHHSTPGYLLQFKHACTALGQPMPLGRTLRQHIMALSGVQIAPDFSDQLLEYHYQHIYGQAERDMLEEKRLSQKIREWKQAHSS